MEQQSVFNYETITIDKIVSGGYGLSKLANNKVIFVKNALPGELIKVRFKENKKDFVFGRVEEYLETSNKRIKPICPLFGTCGGCQYQMVSYEDQLKIKYEIIQENLSRIGKLFIESLLQPIVASPNGLYYRNKGSFQVFNGGEIGFCKPGTTFPFGIEKCFLMEDAINKKIHFFAIPENKEQIQKLKALNIRSNSLGETIDSSIKHDTFYDTVEDLQFLVDVDTFFQVNRAVIPLWLNYIKEQVEKYTQGDFLLDLFCGVGIIGQYLSPLFKSVVGLEINKRLVENGQKVLELNNIKNMQILEQDASAFWEKTNSIDTLILNPPRTGLHNNMIEILLEKKPRVLIYSSCNPDTFARDLNILTEKGGYTLDNITPFDMFPQTSHAEIVTVLYQK